MDNLGKAGDFFERMESPTRSTADPLISLRDYTEMIGARYLRGLDPTSTASNYRGAMKLRVLPALGHLPIRSITTGMIDRTIDAWESTCSPSTLKNTIAALTRALDEAMLGRSHPKVAAMLTDAQPDLLAFAAFPRRHWR